MIKKLLFVLFLSIAPTISISAETCTLEIDFSFSVPGDQAKQLQGYRLYKDGLQVCEKEDLSTSKMVCQFPSESGTFDFTLTAYYTDSTESPPSPSFPFTIDPQPTTPDDSSPPESIVSKEHRAAVSSILSHVYNLLLFHKPNQ